MAWSKEDITQAEQDAWIAGKPCFVGFNVLSLSVVTPEWSTLGGWPTSTDSVDPDAPTSRLTDGKGTPTSYPTGTSAFWALLFELDDTDARNEFDCALLLGHNFEEITSGQLDVSIRIADTNDFSGASARYPYVWEDVGGNPLRLQSFDLDDQSDDMPQRYSGVKYVAVYFTGTGTGNYIPRIGELVLGRRRQLVRAPTDDHDPSPRESQVIDRAHDGGGSSRYLLASQPISLDAEWVLSSDETDLTTIADLATDTAGFVEPMAYLLGSDNTFVWMLPDPKYRRPQTGAIRTFKLRAQEQVPLLFAELSGE